MKKLVLTLAGLTLALTACAGQSGPVAESAPAPKPSVTAPKVTEAPKPVEQVKVKPKPVETVAPAPVTVQAAPEPVEAPAPAPMPVVEPVAPVAPMPAVDLAPATAYVAPENYDVDAPEYAEDITDAQMAGLGYAQDTTTGAWVNPEAPVANEGSQMGGDLTPEQVEALKYPQTFAEPTPPTTCPEGFAANSPVHGGGCIKIDPAWNLGQGAGGNYDYASDPANQK